MGRSISEKTKNKLFALSGNKCAFSGCPQLIFSEDSDEDVSVSNICHIEAAKEGGPRYNSDQMDIERNCYDNLILLCPNHHTIIDNVKKYTVRDLNEMKRRHEKRIVGLGKDDEMRCKREVLLEYLRKDADKRHSFERIKEDLKRKLTEADVIELICLYPKDFRLVKIKRSDGRILSGVARVIQNG
jgi:hypothetical protein